MAWFVRCHEIAPPDDRGYRLHLCSRFGRVAHLYIVRNSDNYAFEIDRARLVDKAFIERVCSAMTFIGAMEAAGL